MEIADNTLVALFMNSIDKVILFVFANPQKVINVVTLVVVFFILRLIRQINKHSRIQNEVLEQQNIINKSQISVNDMVTRRMKRLEERIFELEGKG